MAQLSSGTLRNFLLAALPKAVVLDDTQSPKPIVLRIPGLGEARIYLWTATPDHSTSGRPRGEYKSQIIIPSLPRSARQHFDLSDIPTFLLGFSPDFGVFVLWQIDRHQNSAYSKNLQVAQSLLQEAASSGWAIASPRPTNLGPEVRCAVHPSHLGRLLGVTLDLDRKNIQDQSRQILLESAAPDVEDRRIGEALSSGNIITLEEVKNERKRISQMRLQRSNRFSTDVLPLYNFSCAICEVQLHIVEAAHIIRVHDIRSLDEPWNGLSLCGNHHRLYDRRIMLVDGTATVRSNREILEVIKSEELGNGLDVWVQPFLDRPLAVLPPAFISDMIFQSNMKNALTLNFSM